MNAEALKQYLKTLPAKSIRQIEVISNPSARYGGGKAVVNIVLQNKTINNRFVSMGFNANSKPTFLSWISYIYNSAMWEMDVYANMGYSHEQTLTQGHEVLTWFGNDTSRSDTYRRQRNDRNINTLFSLDLAYHYDSLTTAYFWLNGFPMWAGWSSYEERERTEYLYHPGDYSFTERMTKKASGFPSIGMFDGIWVDRRFDDSTGHMLSLGYYGSLWHNDSVINGQRHFLSPSKNDMTYREQHLGTEWFHGVEAYYLRPFGQRDTDRNLTAYEWELGLEGNCSHLRKDTRFDTLGINGYARYPWLECQSDSYSAQSDIYTSILRRWDKLTFKGGIRGGVQWGQVYYPDAPQHNYTYRDFTLLPSLHLSYRLANSDAISLSYTRRRIVPNGSDYSTRRIYSLDGFTTGNKDLTCGSSHHIEAKWDKYIDGWGALGINLFYLKKTKSQDVLTDIVYDDQYFQSIATFDQPVNIGNAWNSGIDMHTIYRPSALVNVKVNASLFYDHIFLRRTDIGEVLNNGMWCCSLRMASWVKLWNQLQLYGTMYYNSPTQRLFCTTLSRKGIDLGLHADLWHHKLSISASVNDVLNWNRWSTTNANPNITSNTDMKFQSRYASFGITLRFGEMELEQASGASRHGKRAAANEGYSDE